MTTVLHVHEQAFFHFPRNKMNQMLILFCLSLFQRKLIIELVTTGQLFTVLCLSFVYELVKIINCCNVHRVQTNTNPVSEKLVTAEGDL